MRGNSGASSYAQGLTNVMERCIRTDERQDALASLEQCALSLTRARRSEGAWKWVVLSFHSAFQGAMVCHLSGTAQLGALTRKSASEWLKWYERKNAGELETVREDVNEFGMVRRTYASKDAPPNERAAPPLDLLKRLSCESARLEPAGGIITLTASQQKSFQRLNTLRNKLTHFRPKGWSIEIEFIKAAMEDVLDVLESIASDPWPFRHLSVEEHDRLRSTIPEIRRLLSDA